MRAIRRAYGYSRADFAEFLGVEPEHLARSEQKNKLPNKKGRRRTLNNYERDAGLPELAFRFDLIEDD
jgi:transcriptional regulator with XRE-family HTH domain